MGRIVVGIDGSEASRRALRWAADEASLRGASLEVVHVYEDPMTFYRGNENLTAGAAEMIQRELEAAARQAAADAQALVDAMVAPLDHPQVEGTAVESSRPAQTLVERAQGADLLVVGSRGRGGFSGLLLGSVSQKCVHHAQCPVVIIRSEVAEPA